MDCSTPGSSVPSPRVCSNSCPLSQWCYLSISFSALSFFCLLSFPVSGSFSINRLFASGGWSIGASALASVLSVNIPGWFPWWLVWSPCSPRNSQESPPAPQLESINSLAFSFFYGPTLTPVQDYQAWHKWLNDRYFFFHLSTIKDESNNKKD